MIRRIIRFFVRWPTPLHEALYDHALNGTPLRWHERLRFRLLDTQ